MFLIKKKKINSIKHNLVILGIKFKKNIYMLKFTNIFVCYSYNTIINYKKNNNSILFKSKNPINNYFNYDFLKINHIFHDVISSFNIFNKNIQTLYKYITACDNFSLFYILIFSKKLKYLYKAGYGNYAILLYKQKVKKKLTFMLPSKLKIYTNLWILGLLGKNIFSDLNRYISSKNSMNLKKKKINVRGVAMNPVDHHNGGRSKKKPLFLNKYNNIAKYNK